MASSVYGKCQEDCARTCDRTLAMCMATCVRDRCDPDTRSMLEKLVVQVVLGSEAWLG